MIWSAAVIVAAPLTDAPERREMQGIEGANKRYRGDLSGE